MVGPDCVQLEVKVLGKAGRADDSARPEKPVKAGTGGRRVVAEGATSAVLTEGEAGAGTAAEGAGNAKPLVNGSGAGGGPVEGARREMPLQKGTWRARASDAEGARNETKLKGLGGTGGAAAAAAGAGWVGWKSESRCTTTLPHVEMLWSRADSSAPREVNTRAAVTGRDGSAAAVARMSAERAMRASLWATASASVSPTAAAESAARTVVASARRASLFASSDWSAECTVEAVDSRSFTERTPTSMLR